jgi:hypothetical protein
MLVASLTRYSQMTYSGKPVSARQDQYDRGHYSRRDPVQNVSVTMNGISVSAKRVVDIIWLIDGIAFQTDILALARWRTPSRTLSFATQAANDEFVI